MIFDFIFFVFQQIWFCAGIFLLIWVAFAHMTGRRYDFCGMLLGILSIVFLAIWFVLETIWSAIACLFSKGKDEEDPEHK